MAPELASECDLLEQPLLKRLLPQLARGKRVVRRRRGLLDPRQEHVAVVGHEVGAVPVALEYSGDLGHDALAALDEPM